MNEFTSHMLEVVHAHMVLRKSHMVRTWRSDSILVLTGLLVISQRERLLALLQKLYMSCGAAKLEAVEELR